MQMQVAHGSSCEQRLRVAGGLKCHYKTTYGK
jgi:hypothetical protein